MSLQGKDVLILDDDPDFRRLFEKLLATVGMNVISAKSVSEALELAKKRAPHLILTDLNMPGESGFELLERRRATPALATIPAIVVSGLKDRASVHRALALGATDYLAKPITVPALLQKIRKALHEKEFLKVEFNPGARPRVSVTLRARVKGLTETGAFLVSPARIAPRTQLVLRSEVLKGTGLEDCVALTHKSPSYLISGGHYGVYAALAGLSKNNIEKIRELLESWEWHRI